MGTLVVGCLACGPAATPEQHEAEDVPNASAPLQSSEAARYRLSARPLDPEAPRGRLHAWVVHLELPDGELFTPTHLAVDGGMPQHGHGMVTRPQVTRSLGGGDFLVEGMRFHMAGDWVLRVEVVGPSGPDVATIDVRVAP